MKDKRDGGWEGRAVRISVGVEPRVYYQEKPGMAASRLPSLI